QERSKAEVASGFTRFQEGDILVPKITPTFEADRAAMASGLRNRVGCGTTELHVLRALSGTLPRFLYYLVRSRPFLGFGAAEMQGVAGQKRVPDEYIRDAKVALPPLN